MADAPAFDSYLTIRAGLVQFARFVRAIEQHLPSKGYLTDKPRATIMLT